MANRNDGPAQKNWRDDRILSTVVRILEDDGYDAVQLRDVARLSQTSMATIYKRYSNREELIATAVQAWMDQYRFAALSDQAPGPGDSLYDGVMRLLRTIFHPWEQHPGMLKAYFRARAAPGGQQLVRHGLDMAVPVFLGALAGADDDLIADLDTVISSLVYGLVGRFTAGEIAVTDILPVLERAVFRLTEGHSVRSSHAASRRVATARRRR